MPRSRCGPASEPVLHTKLHNTQRKCAAHKVEPNDYDVLIDIAITHVRSFIELRPPRRERSVRNSPYPARRKNKNKDDIIIPLHKCRQICASERASVLTSAGTNYSGRLDSAIEWGIPVFISGADSCQTVEEADGFPRVGLVLFSVIIQIIRI